MTVYFTSYKKQAISCALLCNVAFLLIACGTSVESASLTPSNVAPMKAGDYHQTLKVGEQNRTYSIHLPSVISTIQSLPLVVVLHDKGGDAASIARETQMSVKAEQEGFIVVYPNGIAPVSSSKQQLTWNCCGPAEKKSNGIDDVGFIHILIDHLENIYKIDLNRIFATGMADGGNMAYRLACELPGTFAAIAPVAANFGYAQCQPTQPVSVASFRGTADTTVQQPISYAISFWIQQDQCTAVARRERNGNILKTIYSSGQNGTEVVLYSIINGIHIWSNPTTALVWDFFVTHAKTS